MRKEKTIAWQDFPEEVKEYLEESWASYPPHNGSFKKWYVHDEQKPREEHKGGEILYVDKDIDYVVERGEDLVSDYLLDKYKCKRGEEVLIKISW